MYPIRLLFSAKDREKCIYADTYQVIENAIAEQKCITASTDNCTKLMIKPYAILSDVYTGYYYLVAYACKEPAEEFEISTFRLSRLHNPKKCRGDYLSEKEIYTLQNKLKGSSPAYLCNDAVEIQVMMTKTGEEIFQKIIRNRPKLKDKEDIRIQNSAFSAKYTFFCTTFQAANYFHKFGADAVIVQPQSLHDEQKEWYYQAAKKYESW